MESIKAFFPLPCKHAFHDFCDYERMSYGNRLQTAIDLAETDRASLARALKVSVQSIGQTINGATKAHTAENCAKAAKALGVDPFWLATGEGEPRPARQSDWPFTDELQQAVSKLDVDANFRLENVIRAHLGMETLHKLAPQELPNGVLTETIQAALRQNIPTGSAARSGLTVVQPDNRPAPHTPALDAEDARHRRQDSYAGSSHHSPAGPKGNGGPH